jgi:GntR family transcriptional regulator/MocR family aminotransferase
MTSQAPGILPAIAIDRAGDRPLYRQIYEGYREAILERRLRGGQAGPSSLASSMLALPPQSGRASMLPSYSSQLWEPVRG